MTEPNSSPPKARLLLAAISSFFILTFWHLAMSYLGFYTSPSPDMSRDTQKHPKISKISPSLPLDLALSDAQTDPEPGSLKLKDTYVQGSFNRRGARFDSLILTHYHESTDPQSPAIRLLDSTPGNRYTVAVGWRSPDETLQLPTSRTVWNLDAPDTLTWKSSQGLIFQQIIQNQDAYLFKISQTVTNTLDRPVRFNFTGNIHRQNPGSTGSFLLHEGPLGVFDGILKEVSYSSLEGQAPVIASANSGWVGVTDKYWLSAIAPEAGSLKAHFYHTDSGYHVAFSTPLTTLQPGQSLTQASWVFLGPKELHRLELYEKSYAINRLHLAVDFGWFYFLTKPLFIVLAFFKHLTGNFGLGILLLTFFLSALFLPLTIKTYRAQGRMRYLQPKIRSLQTTYAQDSTRLNQEIFKLYRTEKVNPVAGCLPMLIQIPVFAALYKVLFVTLEMRHAPFMGWIKDLSAPDPYNLFNLMGLIPWNPPFSLGLLPLIMGLSLFLQQKMNPAPQDPLQAKMFLYAMPLMVTFSLAGFPSGLLIYWIGRNILTIIQQVIWGRKLK